jgi:hypothetical protein
MQLIAEISDNDGVRKVLEQMELDEIAREIARRMQMDPTDTKLVSGAAAGLPDLIKKTSGTAYAASDFVAYIQYPPGKQDLAQKLQAALGGLGMKTPGMEQVSSAPKADEIRLYKAAHAEFAQKLKSDLAGTTGLSFEPRVLGNSGQLPDGIMEFWIAK